MSNPGEADATAITQTSQLAAWFAAGCKPASEFRIGTEHESFGFTLNGQHPPRYEGGIRELLDMIGADEGLTPILDRGNPIGLTGRNFSISLEPGGQFELSGGIVASLHETKAEIDAHIARIHRVAPKLGLGFAPLGFHPTGTRADFDWMPKGRYAIMRAYMPRVGTRGFDMMLRTCTVQANLDFASEADMVRKMRVGYALQPLATALFANGPFREGKPDGMLSNRAYTWLDTDNARSGIPRAVFEDGFGFERYADYLLDVPMYFVYRDGRYIDVSGRSFRDFMAGRLAGFEGQTPTIGDFADHATTAFPDVRLKRFIETRGADSGNPAMLLAQPAFWTGLFYDDAALEAACELIRDIDYDTLITLRNEVPRAGLDIKLGKGTLRDLGRDAVAIAAEGLRARAQFNAAGEDERIYLAPLQAITEGEPTQAEYWLGRYLGAWHGDVTRIFAEAAL
ncbi:MAG: glutamate--cysteine ligase [Acidiphilium sp. 37-64-53]|uniref:glutamate--cysteine ligase n=1 Tax=Acidiphilium TaxID=522 RepID=UPI000BD9BE98|nr:MULTISPECIES: glutamate--cysteine ligase [Acidiphilium]OYW00514.1 MAG: glutamate--cysteine ligase [Acidiphilium sp. 37-64-53]OZB23138.1 MAG: glutamate--cysteine ligase [Acidiphilium sp. 34-64-41]HQT86162.1 glutamate--cysteine ligase [Acidiphilium rubrum]